jgi:hypothetical protein
VVSGVLLDVSGKLGVPLAAAGQLSTTFAIAHAIGAALLGTLAERRDRRSVLLAALVASLLKLPAVEGVALVDWPQAAALIVQLNRRRSCGLRDDRRMPCVTPCRSAPILVLTLGT